MGNMMDVEIINFLDDLKNKTSIDFSIYSADGERLYGKSLNLNEKTLFCQEISSSKKDNLTTFPLRLKNKNFVGALKGASLIERNYASLIVEVSLRTSFNKISSGKDGFSLSLLKGELNYSEILSGAKTYGIENCENCAMIVSYPDGYSFEVINTLLNYGSSSSDFAVALTSNTLAFVKFCDDVVGEYHSYADFAESACQSILQEYGATVHISLGEPVKTIIDTPVSFSQATTTQRLVEEEKAFGFVHSFKEYAIVKILEDVPKAKLNEYAELLMSDKASEIFDDREMLETAETFLESNLNQSETSRKLYLHRNTLNYRLDKIEKITGLNIRKFADAMTFRLMTVLFKLKR